jgi:proteasome lid subunit RPN8/RPN11
MYSLYISKKLIKQFKDISKDAFPSEILCYLVGDIEHNIITVEEFWFPENILDYCDHNTVNIQPHWGLEAIDYAKDNDMVISGSLHSHPYTKEELALYNCTGKHQSEADIDSCGMAWQQIAGICVVKESPSGRLSSSIRFWGPTVPLEVRID